jgi:NAD(P)H-hydrate epimerase
MHKVLSSSQMRQLDQATIQELKISSWQLMEHASYVVSLKIASMWQVSTKITVLAGPGNNGGDALAVARLLQGWGYNVKTYLFNLKQKLSEDCLINKQRLLQNESSVFQELINTDGLPSFEDAELIIDGLFGTGLNQPLSGGYASCVAKINSSGAIVVSIDMPSGLMDQDNSHVSAETIVHAHHTFTFHGYKLSLLLDSSARYAGHVHVLDIDLSQKEEQCLKTPYHVVTELDARKMLRQRPIVSHKGTFGHALLIAGQYGMAGASILAAKACLRMGVGKITVHTPFKNNDIVQISVPEAILSHDANAVCMSSFPEHINTYDAVGIGPGIGLNPSTVNAVLQFFQQSRIPLVVDADALNILACHPDYLAYLPKGSILTPHVGELKRLGCQSDHTFQQVDFALHLAVKHQVYVILKGHRTAICQPNGEVCFNTTGNSGMATAGSGDVLTGILTSLLAQGYPPHEACVLGVYLHGLAGDCVVQHGSEESLVASDLMRSLPRAISYLKSAQTDHDVCKNELI